MKDLKEMMIKRSPSSEVGEVYERYYFLFNTLFTIISGLVCKYRYIPKPINNKTIAEGASFGDFFTSVIRR